MSEIINNNSIVEDPEISLKELILKLQVWWRLMLSKWKIIIAAGVIGGLLGLVYVYSKKPVYKAELSFAIQNQNINSSSSNIASQLGIDLASNGGSEFLGDNLLELMKSRFMVEKALLTPVTINNKNETLADFYIDFNKIRVGWKDDPRLVNLHFLPGADRSRFTLQQDSVLGAFQKDLVTSSLTVGKTESSIITLQITSTNEKFAKYFAEVLTKVVSDFYVQTKTEKSSRSVAILQRQQDSVRRMLNSAISGVASSADYNPNPNPSLQSIHVPVQRKQFDVQANTAILTELVKNLQTARMSLLQDTPLIQVIDRPILPLDKTTYSKRRGIMIGVVLGVLLTVVALSVINFLKAVMN